MRASLERIWENVRDWEHLPWLHRRSFLDIQLEVGVVGDVPKVLRGAKLSKKDCIDKWERAQAEDLHTLDVSLNAVSQEAFRLFENYKFRLKKE
ncbi:MAG: hypothetical protein E6L09_13880 [Verrucomicrobia bacterium]|nr:MAG: hypothetical protein E6L09_13880 [Verrucomicrobiota bacterium]